MKSIILSLKYIKYFFSADTRHDIHSPFVFNLLTLAILKTENKPVFEKIEKIRKNMLRDQSIVKIRDFGAGFGGKQYQEKKIQFIASHSSKSKKYSQLLYRIIAYFTPSVILELGTSVGISAMYQAAAAPGSKITTMEGCENTAKIAAANFKNAGFENITQITGDFDEILPSFLAITPRLDYVFIDGNHRKEPVLKYFNACLQNINKHSFFIIDDINWSAEMAEAWKEIKLNPRVSVTIDMFMLGIVFFNPELTKQDFTIRF